MKTKKQCHWQIENYEEKKEKLKKIQWYNSQIYLTNIMIRQYKEELEMAERRHENGDCGRTCSIVREDLQEQLNERENQLIKLLKDKMKNEEFYKHYE